MTFDIFTFIKTLKLSININKVLEHCITTKAETGNIFLGITCSDHTGLALLILTLLVSNYQSVTPACKGVKTG